jgi:pectin methylesterase-like acyl-CoA thioesterase
MVCSKRVSDENRMAKMSRTIMCTALAMVFGAAAAILFGTSASAATLVAGKCALGGYAQIQQAVDQAASGDTVQVCPGTYPEQVVIKKNITLIGIKGKTGYPTIIYPTSTDTV